MATMTGTIKNDWLIGTSGNDAIWGLGGNDTLKGGGGADYLSGGSGIDTASYIDSFQWVEIDLLTGRGYSGDAQGDTLAGIENVMGSSYGDRLSGDNGANTFYGMDGNDTLEGRGGADVLEGGYGNDILLGGAGSDVLNGGEGSDTVNYLESPAAVFVALSSHFASGGDADGDTLISIESAYGSSFADTLWGDNNWNVLAGNDGNDGLMGFGGVDQLFGGAGHDALQGMDGDDYAYGGEGNDRISGGAGLDRLRGDGGADTFVWFSTNETGVIRGTADIVSDFAAADGDRLDLRAIDANVYAAGDQAFRFIGTAAFSGRPGEINYYHLDGNTYIQMQTGTSPDVEGVIRLSGIHTPEASWFVL